MILPTTPSISIIHFLRDLLHPSTKLRGLHDSGAYQDIPVYSNVIYTSFGEQCRRAYEFYHHPKINKKCGEAYSNEMWKCLCGEYMLPLVETPSQVHIFQYDSYQLQNELGMYHNYYHPTDPNSHEQNEKILLIV